LHHQICTYPKSWGGGKTSHSRTKPFLGEEVCEKTITMFRTSCGLSTQKRVKNSQITPQSFLHSSRFQNQQNQCRPGGDKRADAALGFGSRFFCQFCATFCLQRLLLTKFFVAFNSSKIGLFRRKFRLEHEFLKRDLYPHSNWLNDYFFEIDNFDKVFPVNLFTSSNLDQILSTT
jgi:hypothetical protein